MNSMNIDTESSPNSPLELWAHQNDLPVDFASRLASQSTLPTDEEKIDIELLMPNRGCSLHTSIAVHGPSDYDSDSTDTDMVPPLTRGNSTASSPSALDTDCASVVDGGCVLESHDGILTLPDRPQPGADLMCPFQVLECEEVFATVVEFKMHCFSHFRGHPLPEYAPCFLCDTAFFQQPEHDPSRAWNEMMTHMAYEHFRAGQESGIFKPNIALMRYMWNRKIISDAQLKRCQLVVEPTSLVSARDMFGRPRQVPEVPMAPPATPPSPIRAHFTQSVGSHSEPYVVMAGRRAERRQRNVGYLMARVRS